MREQQMLEFTQSGMITIPKLVYCAQWIQVAQLDKFSSGIINSEQYMDHILNQFFKPFTDE
jgi:hypothetical protein